LFKKTTPEESGVGAIETKTNDFPLSGGSCLSTHLENKSKIAANRYH
jgi:hypothetical protein